MKTSIDLENYIVDIQHRVHLASQEPDDDLEMIDVTLSEIRFTEDDSVAEIPVGHAHLLYYDSAGSQEDFTFDVFDAHSEDTGEIYAALYCDLHGTPRRFWRGKDNSVLILDRLRIVTEHRGKGLGEQLARCIVRVLGRRAGIIVTKPFPIELQQQQSSENLRNHPLFEQELQRVERFYRRNGFRRVPRSKIMFWQP